MNWIEVIQIRVSGKDHGILKPKLDQLIKEVNQGTDHKLVVYRQLDLHSDIRIHLIHSTIKVEKNGSSLGLRLVSALKEYGLVNHNVWLELSGEEK